MWQDPDHRHAGVFPGLAHLLEHMAFKGTPRIGTKDFSREAPLLDACDEGRQAGPVGQ